MRCSAPAPGRARAAALAGTLLAALAVAGCRSGSTPTGNANSGGVEASASRQPGPSARPPSGLTGYAAGVGRPQIAVKIDNTRPAFPQVGLGDADIVYLEQVEGQLTRIMAIFSSRLPAQIGPVRSARESDLDLLRQYGRVDFAFSGANSGVLRLVSAAPLNDVSGPTVPAAYHRDLSRPAPYNLFLRPERVLAARPAALASDIGLRFAAAPPTTGRVSAGFSVRFGPSASVTVRYDAGRHGWQILMDGRRRSTAGAGPATPANVIVQYVRVTGSRFHDVLGHVSPRTVSTGTGNAVVFRDGRAVPAHWNRPTVTAGTRFTGAGGADVPLRPGQTWILLVPVGTPLGA
jgi:Protein of unknown function (DUF3048) N-terminal domain/Protein of unknown function (DUF3048) C-terminal domain